MALVRSESHRTITILIPMALPYYLAQRDAKRHSKCAVFIVIKFFKLPISREKLKGAKGQYPPAHHQIPRKERRKTFPFLS